VRECFFSEQAVTGLDHRLIEAGEQLRREQREIVFQRLQGKGQAAFFACAIIP